MKCPKCREKDMVPVFTEQGVEVDFCPDCTGIWLDKGEIFYFTKKSAEIEQELYEAIKKGNRRKEYARGRERICRR